MTENPYQAQITTLDLKAVTGEATREERTILAAVRHRYEGYAEGFAASTALVKELVDALTKISCIPCLTELLGDTTDEPCGCASCRAKAALEAAWEAGVT